MTDPRPLKIGIIGAGMYAATAHVPALRTRPGVEITCACRTRRDKLDRFCEFTGVPRGYTDHREMLGAEALDGVVVASTHRLHCEHTLDCLDRGLPVLLEKPMTITPEDADRLVARADETGVPLIVGYNRRFWPAYVHLKAMLDRGDLGTPRVLVGEYCGDLEWAIARDAESAYGRAEAFYQEGDPPNFRGDQAESGGGFFVDAGTHLIDAICWLAGAEPETVHALMENRGHQTDLDGVVQIRFRNGALATMYFMGSARGGAGSGLTLYGADGTAHVRHDSEFAWAKEGDLQPVTDLPPRDEAGGHFIDVIRDGVPNRCTPREGRTAVAVVSAAYESARTGGAVAIEPMK